MEGRDGARRSRPRRRRASIRGLACSLIALAVSSACVVTAGAQGGPTTDTVKDSKTAGTAAKVKPAGIAPASAGTWTVYAGDTLRSLAKGIHPRNRARQAQYIAAVRSLNPEVAALAEDLSMPTGLQLILPDLKALSGLAPSVISFPVAAPQRAVVQAVEPTPSPPPGPAPAARATSEPPAAEAAASVVPQVLPGHWTVRAGDTVRKLARAIYPNSRARQDLYIAELRALNPQLGSVADDAVLDANAQLGMPDLKKLSSVRVEGAGASGKPPGRAAKATPPKRIAPSTPETPRAPVQKPTGGSTAAAMRPTAPSPAASKPAPTPPEAAFRLKLSGAEIDLSRSRNISENERRALRENQLMLDADDQRAALLSLRNTIRQLEVRISELQLKTASVLAAPATVPVAPPPVSPAAEPRPAVVAPQPAATVPVVPAEPAPAPPVPTPASQKPDVKAVETRPATDAPTKPAPADSDWLTMLTSMPALIAIVAIAIALFGLLAWSRRGSGPAKKYRINNVAPSPEVAAAETPRSEDDDAAAMLPERAVSHPPAQETHATPYAGAIARSSAPTAADGDDQQSFDVTLKLDSPINVDDSPARFDLDVSPTTTVDFPIGLDDKPGEDRVRRLQYMYERYPELMTHTVSIDDADSVINAARLYYEEDHRDKACELLTFGVEERPQETRFWLAQFEIFRLENMVAEFAELASKYHVLFGSSPAWPKVRHIGHELDPSNTLFAAAGRDALAGEMHFDPVAENWLNAPMDFTSDALTSDLRLALFDDHGVDRPDFESITARLAAGATPVQ